MPTQSYIQFDGIGELSTGFTILFSTNYLSDEVGVLLELPDFEVSHSHSSGTHSFVIDGLTFNYVGVIDDWVGVGIVFKANESSLSLYVDGVLVSSQELLRPPIPSGSVKVGDTKTARISDFRLYNKVISEGAIVYYNDDAKREMLALGRLG